MKAMSSLLSGKGACRVKLTLEVETGGEADRELPGKGAESTLLDMSVGDVGFESRLSEVLKYSVEKDSKTRVRFARVVGEEGKRRCVVTEGVRGGGEVDKLRTEVSSLSSVNAVLAGEVEGLGTRLSGGPAEMAAAVGQRTAETAWWKTGSGVLERELPPASLGTSAVSMPVQERGVGQAVFEGFCSVTQVEIPPGVTSIGCGALSGCSLLQRVSVPAGVTEIGARAFNGCAVLVVVSLPVGVVSIGDEAFSGCTALTRLEIPEGVVTIGNQAFAECSSLSEIVLPGSVETIGQCAFSKCTALLEVAVPPRVTSVPAGLFSFCSKLMRVRLPDGVTEVGDRAFMRCASLTRLEIPAGVRSLDPSTFSPSGVHDLTLPSTIEVAVYYLGSFPQLTRLALVGSRVGSGAVTVRGYLAPGAKIVGSPELVGKRIGFMGPKIEPLEDDRQVLEERPSAPQREPRPCGTAHVGHLKTD
jgi:hypothetical protein